jgi:hypothetical protein
MWVKAWDRTLFVCLHCKLPSNSILVPAASEQLSTQSSIKNKMEDPKIKANLAAVEAHFHNEGLNEIEKACEGYTRRHCVGSASSKPPFRKQAGRDR